MTIGLDLLIHIPQTINWTWFYVMSGFVALSAGYTFFLLKTRLNVLVLLILALAGESPTCILHESIHIL